MLKKILSMAIAFSLAAFVMPYANAETLFKQTYDMTGKDPVLVAEVPDGDYKINTVTGGDSETNANVYINGGERVRSYTLEAGKDQDNEQFAVPKDGKITIEVKGDAPNLKSVTIEQLPARKKGEHPTLYIAGDSTAQTYDYSKVYPQTGWGQVFGDYFSDEITIENRSMGGRSSKSFDNDGRLDKILAEIRPGDYLFIQFGINDGAVNKPERYISVEDYKQLISDKYINETVKRGAVPVLLTATAAAWWDEEKHEFMESRQDYAVPTKEIAAETGVTLIDINKIATDEYNAVEILSDEYKQKTLSGYFICEPLESAAYPAGTDDHTHLKEKGARAQARMIADSVYDSITELSKYVVKNPASKFNDITDHWAYDYILSATDELNVKGRTSEAFVPEENITRAEFLKLAMDAAGINGHAYREGECLDAEVDDWYRFYLQGALDKDIIPVELIENCTSTKVTKTLSEASEDKAALTADITVYEGSFNGDTPITREEAAAILYNTLNTVFGEELETGAPAQTLFKDETNISNWAYDSIIAISNMGIMCGYEDGTIKPDNNLTRAEAVKLAAITYQRVTSPSI